MEPGATILVTGGAGFIGSAVVRHLMHATGHSVVNLDALTYAASPEAVEEATGNPRYAFVHGDIRDRATLRTVFADHRPTGVIHLAAESHVDRSIDGPADFVTTNVVGTFNLLEEARRHWLGLEGAAREAFRVVHVSTDEVYGSLEAEGAFHEASPYDPSSPYSATKAAADHLVRAWHRTYGLPVIVTNSSNNYGPYQVPEKLVPLTIINALEGREIPVYGRGDNVRDWIHVADHAAALVTVLEEGRPGETYLVGARNEWRNIDLVRRICGLVDELAPDAGIARREELIRLVEDRPGHDLRYAIDPRKLEAELGWQPEWRLEDGLRDTVRWYLDHQEWWRAKREAGAGERRGLGVEEVR